MLKRLWILISADHFKKLMFARYTKTATQKRLQAYSNGKAGYATTGRTFAGAFTPLEDKMAITLGLAGKGFSYIVDGASDIKAADILTIDSVDYHVQGASRYIQASIDILKCILVLSVKTTA